MHDMTPEMAAKIVAAAVALRKQWGNMLTSADIDSAQLLDAVVVLNEDYTRRMDNMKEQVVLANRQAGAAAARASKARKRADKQDTEQ